MVPKSCTPSHCCGQCALVRFLKHHHHGVGASPISDLTDVHFVRHTSLGEFACYADRFTSIKSNQLAFYCRLIFFGWPLFLGHVAAALVQIPTIIGIPTAVTSVQMAVFALWPFGQGA